MPEPLGVLPGVLTGALARARAQSALLATAAALLLLATTLTATGAHLLTGGQDAALAVALAAAPARETTAVARLALAAGTTGAEQQQVLDEAADVLAAGVAPATAQRATAWSSSARYLDPPGGPAGAPSRLDLDSGTLAAVGSFDAAGGLAAHAELVSGRWPGPPGPSGGALEVAVPDAALGVGDVPAAGSAAVLTPAPADESATAPLTVVVVGTYRPRAGDPLWQLDPLRGAGTTAASGVPGTSGRVQRPAVGPLLVDPAALAAGTPGTPGGLTAATGGAVVVPHLEDLTPGQARDLVAEAARAPSPSTAVRDALGGRVTAAAVSAAAPGLLQRSATQQRTAGAGLLVAAVAGAGSALVALAAVAQLLAARRRDESVLLAVRGASHRQQLVRDAAELVPLVAVAVALAAPLSVLAAARLLGGALGAGTPSPDALGGGGTALGVAAATGVVAVGVVLVVLARGRTAGAGGTPGRAVRTPLRGPLARSGADVLLLAVAAAAAWQLRSGGSSSGVVLVLAPLLALLASALLGLRVLGLLRRAGERGARRSSGAPAAVAGWALARGPLAGAAAALVVLSAATATTTLAWRAAWSASTAQQVLAAQGAAFVVEEPGAAGTTGSTTDGGVGALRTSAALTAATGLDPSPVAVLRVALGTRSAADPVSLVAAPADALGAVAGSRQLAGSVPSGPVLSGPVLPAGPVRLVVGGRGTVDVALADRLRLPELRVVPSLVVRDPGGALAVLDGAPVELDGQAHDVALPDPGATGELQAVGAWLRLLPGQDDDPDDPLAVVEQRLEVRLDLPGAQPASSPDAAATASWSATAGGDGAEGALSSTSAQLDPAGGRPAVVVRALVRPAALPPTGAVVRAQSVPAPEAVPVLVSPELADQVGARTGQQLAVVVGRQQVVARVAGVVPAVPAAPGAPALLADADALDAALLARGVVPAPDRWWLTAPGRGLSAEQQRAATAAVEAAGLGSATGLARATDEAQRAPLAAALRAGWALLLVAAAAAALAGPALQVAAAAPDDARTGARLAVLGVPRRDRVRVAVAPRAAQLLLGLLVGVLAGLVVAVAVVPALVRAPDGGLPVPRLDAAGVLRAALTGAPLELAAGVLLVLAMLTAAPLLVAGTTASRASHRDGSP